MPPERMAEESLRTEWLGFPEPDVREPEAGSGKGKADSARGSTLAGGFSFRMINFPPPHHGANAEPSAEGLTSHASTSPPTKMPNANNLRRPLSIVLSILSPIQL